jgi:hypothetical protein
MGKIQMLAIIITIDMRLLHSYNALLVYGVVILTSETCLSLKASLRREVVWVSLGYK